MGVDRKMIVFFFPFLSSLVVLLSREANICVDYDDDVGIHFFAINCPPSPRHLSRAYLIRCSRVMRRIPNVLGSCSRRAGNVRLLRSSENVCWIIGLIYKNFATHARSLPYLLASPMCRSVSW